ncbi:ABC transporter substrate-binding protein [Pseudoruegeria sp. HB172150]|uniref:ABC transporter substrate-binding protein n=1 Tax=Pseudoruegeria sp. HB172150 TaxID=2721164 RepID=UPI0015582875|nr:ABC transporter substrate-binding protein [Pseudoruegeria sp. HB172150]
MKFTASFTLFATAAILLSGQVLAEGFDTSGIEVNPELAARVPERIREAGVLVGGSDNAYAPWEYLAGPDGQTPEGIDIDIGDAITAKWGLTYESQTSPFDAILPALGSKFDIGLNAFSISQERMEVVDFVSYFRSTSLWAVKAGNPTEFDPADLCGRLIAVATGSWDETQLIKISDQCVADGEEAITMLPFGLQPEALTRVAAGGADATVGGDSTIALAIKQSNGMLEGLPGAGIFGQTGLNGIAVAKSDPELTQLIADTLNELIEEGTYGDLMEAWGLSLSIETAEINPHVDH